VVPKGLPQLARWDGLKTQNGSAWRTLCRREAYIPENRTLRRLIVTGPEDPKVFDLHRNLGLAFSSYPPIGRNGCGKSGAVTRMYLALDVNFRDPSNPTFGLPLKCGSDSRAEKNWIPFEKMGKLYFVYSVVPHVVMGAATGEGTCGEKFFTNFPPLVEVQAKNPGYAFSGSAQAVLMNCSTCTSLLPTPHYLALFHIKDPKTGRYAHFAYRFKADPPFQILQVSAQLPLMAARAEDGGAGFAFASGLAVKDDWMVVITYSAGDRESRALILTLEDLDGLFGAHNSTEAHI